MAEATTSLVDWGSPPATVHVAVARGRPNLSCQRPQLHYSPQRHDDCRACSLVRLTHLAAAHCSKIFACFVGLQTDNDYQQNVRCLAFVSHISNQLVCECHAISCGMSHMKRLCPKSASSGSGAPLVIKSLAQDSMQEKGTEAQLLQQ